MSRTRIATAVFVAATAGLLSGVTAASAAPAEPTPSDLAGTASTQLEKNERAFAKIDTDANGVIDEADVEARQHRWYYEFNVQPQSEDGYKIASRAREMWREVLSRADTNRDQEVSRKESGASVQGPGFVQKVISPFSQATFELSDRDGDGKVSRQELAQLQSQAGVSDDDIRAGFRQLDTDQSGFVQRDEFAPAVHDVYVRGNADRALTQLVGNFL